MEGEYEWFLNDLREHDLLLSKSVNLYYSSFQNESSVIKKYLEDKQLFKNGFGKESNMIDVFRLPTSPTFVLIDSNGKIRNIIEGYDDSVLSSIIELVEI